MSAEKIIKRINDFSLAQKVGFLDISISFGYARLLLLHCIFFVVSFI